VLIVSWRYYGLIDCILAAYVLSRMVRSGFE